MSSQGFGFSGGHVWMWELDCEESWTTKNWCFWTVVLEKTLESPLVCKEIQPVHSEGDQPWMFFGRNDAKAETPVLWPPHVKSWLIWKRFWCWEGLRAGGKGDDRGWDGWMASPTQWMWVWVNSGSWWWTGRPGMLQFMGSQRVGHDWATEGNWTEQYHMEKAMAPHSSTLAWKIPWMEEPGRLQSMESLRVGHNWATSLSLFTFMHWRRTWQPTPVFLPGESQGQGSLVGCHLWGCTESDTTEVT